jgi:hypothetical protein
MLDELEVQCMLPNSFIVKARYGFPEELAGPFS